MGQQQLLLIILGVIVVGIAVTVGIVLFKDNAVSANRDAVMSDLMNLAAHAQQYYRRPTILGGGAGTFDGLSSDAAGLKKLTTMPNGTNANGVYSISGGGAGQGPLILKGIGVESGSNGSPVQVVLQVWPDSAKVDNTQMN